MLAPLVKRLFEKTGYKIIKRNFFERHYKHIGDKDFRVAGDLNPLEQLFRRYLSDDFFFIQIGANNGQRFDPIHHLLSSEKELIRGVAVEPVQEYFNELQETYRDFPGIKLVRKAIHNTENTMTIYKIDPSLTNVPEKFKGMASFDSYNFKKDGISESDIITEEVLCISLKSLIEQEQVEKIHLLQIDTEGYDLEIIKKLDFNKLKPKIINFEHRWMYNLASNEDLFPVFRILIDNGYQILFNGNDALAFVE
jgi:FkbM family methyltransferase